jgi:hypothetical protein
MKEVVYLSHVFAHKFEIAGSISATISVLRMLQPKSRIYNSHKNIMDFNPDLMSL